jgi:glycosyltransferase involved in cell wall biosynthesis
VRLLGRVSEHELRYLYDHAVAVASVSVYEGFGLTVAEAASFPSALLVSDIPPHRELLHEDAGVSWVDPWDIDSMAGALARLDRIPRGHHRVDGPTWAEAGAGYSDLLSSVRGGR